MKQKDNNEINFKLNLKKDNNIEIIPSIYKYSSLYSDDYSSNQLLKEEDGYFCTK